MLEGGTGRNGVGWDKQVWSGAGQAAACPESRGNGIRIGRVWVVKSAQYFVDPLSDYIQEARVAMGWACRASQAWGRFDAAVAHKRIKFRRCSNSARSGLETGHIISRIVESHACPVRHT